jgi:CTP-dependent riboflavin kinase
LKTLRIEGIVFSGKGEGARFIELPWVKKQITEKLGFTPHSGTLNLKLTKKELKHRTSLEKAKATEISPAKGFSRGRCFKAYLMDKLKCAVVIPEIPNYPRDIIEVIAPANLREKLQLRDGDPVEVKILLG